MAKDDSRILPGRTFRNKTHVLWGLVLLVPLVPFALFGAWLDPLSVEWTESAKSPGNVAILVVCLLGGDIFLPIPSSVISTLAGNQLGAAWGTGCSWLGMNLAAVLGFGTARYFGRRFQTIESSVANDSEWNAASLVLFRGLPVLAEASVLHAGLKGLTWAKFLPPILLSNLGISAAYAWLGNRVNTGPVLAMILGAVACLPMFVSWAVRKRTS